MSGPTPGSDENYPQGGAPQGQPGWGTPQGPPPGGPQGYGPAPSYSGAPAGYGGPGGQPGWSAPAPAGYGPAPSYAGAPAGPMSIADAVRSVLTQYAGFSGRARRSEFWWFVLAYVIIAVVASIIDAVIGIQLFSWIVTLGLLVPSLAVSVRRLHDTGRSGWWLLLSLIPFAGIVVLVFDCLDSQPGPNRWGPSPKYQSAGGYQGV